MRSAYAVSEITRHTVIQSLLGTAAGSVANALSDSLVDLAGLGKSGQTVIEDSAELVLRSVASGMGYVLLDSILRAVNPSQTDLTDAIIFMHLYMSQQSGLLRSAGRVGHALTSAIGISGSCCGSCASGGKCEGK